MQFLPLSSQIPSWEKDHLLPLSWKNMNPVRMTIWKPIVPNWISVVRPALFVGATNTFVPNVRCWLITTSLYLSERLYLKRWLEKAEYINSSYLLWQRVSIWQVVLTISPLIFTSSKRKIRLVLLVSAIAWLSALAKDLRVRLWLSNPNVCLLDATAS